MATRHEACVWRVGTAGLFAAARVIGEDPRCRCRQPFRTASPFVLLDETSTGLTMLAPLMALSPNFANTLSGERGQH